MKWYLKALRQYADFEGRARRKEYWMFILFSAIFSTLCLLLSNIFSFKPPILYFFSVLFHILPNWAVSVRRLHDIGKSGWWFLIVFIPLIGGLVLLYFNVQDSQPGTNEYGKNPKENN